MKRSAFRVLPVLLAMLLCTAMLLVPAFAADTPTEVYIRIEAEDMTLVPRTKISVDNFDLTSYGAASNPDSARAVHAIIRALESQGLEPATDGTLDVGYDFTGGTIKSICGLESGSEKSWMYTVNQADPGIGVCGYTPKANDEIVVYYIDWMYGNATWFDQDEITAYKDSPFTISLSGFNLMEQMFAAKPDYTGKPIAGAQILVGKDGSFSPEDSTAFSTNEQGMATVTFDSTGTYYLSAERFSEYDDTVLDIARPACLVTVIEPPTFAEAANKIAEQKKNSRGFWDAVSLSSLQKANYIDKAGLMEEAALIAANAKASATDLEKAAIALSAAGVNATAFRVDGQNIDLIDKILNHKDLNSLINAQVYALLALDSGDYGMPAGAVWSREKLVENILSDVCTNGGWTFSGDTADPDMTAMALTALAPYKDQSAVKAEIDKALSVLRTLQEEDGSFASGGMKNSLSTASVIVALRSLGIDIETDFVKDQNTTVDAMMSYLAPDGGFGIDSNAQSSTMATEQCFMALASLQKEEPLYQFAVDSSEKTVTIRIEGMDQTIVPQTSVKVDNFDLQPYGMKNNPSSPTVLHAIIKALQANGYNPLEDGSLAGSEGDYGYFITGIGGLDTADTTTSWMYAVNNTEGQVSVSAYELSDNESVVVYLSDWNVGGYAWFDKQSLSVDTNEEFTLQLKVSKYGAGITPCEGATILVDGKETSYRTDADGKAKIKISTTGTHTISAVRKTGEIIDISRPYCKATVSSSSSTPGSQKTVTLSVIGNSKTGTILAETKRMVGKTDSVFTIVTKALDEKGISYLYTGSGETAYISSIAGLSEFDNGPNSGWNYSINGTQPNKSIGAYIPADGDTIKLTYTGDYTQNNSFGGGGGGGTTTTTKPESKDDIADAIQSILKYYNGKSDLSKWALYGLAVNSQEIPQSYFDALEAELTEKGGNLRLATDYAGLALLLKRTGRPLTDFAGFNILEKIYNNQEIAKQGVNGYIFSLLVLSGEGALPEDALWTPEKIVSELVNYQNSDGGFALSIGGASEIDITAMALAALAPYKDVQSERIDRAIAYLVNAQNSDGTHGYGSDKTSESTAQIIVALAELGIDAKDSRFVKNGKTLLDILLGYQNTDGGFAHIAGESSNAIATEQALLALSAYQLYKQGKGGVYNFDAKLDPVEPQPEQAFSDMDNVSDWAADFIIRAKGYGILNGNESNQCLPQDNLTRAEFVVLLLKTMGLEKADSFTSVFTDVADGSWYTPYVLRAFENGLIHGVGDGLFAPDQPITREDMAVIISNAYQLTGDVQSLDLKDTNTVSLYAKDAVAAVYQNGIMLGSDGWFSPQEFTTREMAVVVMVKLYEDNPS